jgi:hypothetical protein
MVLLTPKGPLHCSSCQSVRQQRPWVECGRIEVLALVSGRQTLKSILAAPASHALVRLLNLVTILALTSRNTEHLELEMDFQSHKAHDTQALTRALRHRPNVSANVQDRFVSGSLMAG